MAEPSIQSDLVGTKAIIIGVFLGLWLFCMSAGAVWGILLWLRRINFI